MNVEYVLLRLARRMMPEALYRFMLKRNILVKAGLESNDPAAAIERYVQALDQHDRTLAGQVVMDFGYGGFLGTAVELLQHGAKHVYLCDKHATLDHRKNATLLESYGDFLRVSEAGIMPNPDTITLIHADLREYLRHSGPLFVDTVLSSSVFEHIHRDEMAATTAALREITTPDGIQAHFIDLRDHFFKYPFQMLYYSQATWERYFNPEVNLNRFRINDYLRVFEANFGRVAWSATEADREAFQTVKERIRPEFRTGDDTIDAVMQIVVIASP